MATRRNHNLLKSLNSFRAGLLQLDEALQIAPASPPLSRGARLDGQAVSLALGIIDTGTDIEICCNNLTPSGTEDLESGTITAFSGQAEAGMSGGPIFRRSGEGFELIAMNILGGGATNYTVTIRDGDIRHFIEDWAQKERRPVPVVCGEGGFGLPEIVRLPLFVDRDEVAFVRCLPPSTQLRVSNARVVYVAAHPLSLSDVDALLKVRRSPTLGEARQRSVADFAENELSELDMLLKTGPEFWRTWLRPAAVPELMQPLARLPATGPLGDLPATEAIEDLPQDRERESAFGKNSYSFSEGGFEWAHEESGDWQRVSWSGHEVRASRFSMQSLGHRPRAAFRPAFAVPVWAGAGGPPTRRSSAGAPVTPDLQEVATDFVDGSLLRGEHRS